MQRTYKVMELSFAFVHNISSPIRPKSLGSLPAAGGVKWKKVGKVKLFGFCEDVQVYRYSVEMGCFAQP